MSNKNEDRPCVKCKHYKSIPNGNYCKLFAKTTCKECGIRGKVTCTTWADAQESRLDECNDGEHFELANILVRIKRSLVK